MATMCSQIPRATRSFRTPAPALVPLVLFLGERVFLFPIYEALRYVIPETKNPEMGLKK